MSTSPSIPPPACEEPVWKQEVSARVEAHRSRRQQRQPALPGLEQTKRRAGLRYSTIAAAVAERYAAAPSYSEYLSSRGAGSSFVTPAIAEPVTDVRQASIQLESPASEAPAHEFPTSGSSALDTHEAQQPLQEPAPAVRVPAPMPLATAVFPPELTVEFAPGFSSPLAQSRTSPRAQTNHVPQPGSPSANFLEEVTIEPNTPLAANLIEFPRQLVATRKARPRLAEGPLRDPATPANAAIDVDGADAAAQLRIFEVEASVPADLLFHAPLMQETAVAAPAEWHYIQLDTPLLSAAASAIPAAAIELPIQPATIHRRLMAASLDLGLILLGFFIFMAGFVAIVPRPPSDTFALAAAAAIFMALSAGYQWLFLSLSDATPGMRYARIALCTFQDDNLSVRARRWRIAALYLSAASAGLGFLWMLFDADHLGWHDRITRTYQRCY